jgi:hypothetical protein
MKSFLVFTLILAFLLGSSSFAQSSKKKSTPKPPRLNARQIDLMERLDYDLVNPPDELIKFWRFRAYDGYHYLRQGEEYTRELERRILQGLRNPSNLPTIFKQFKKDYGALPNEDYRLAALNHIFPSLSHGECSDFLHMTDEEIYILANKYATYLEYWDTEFNKLPKY